MRFGNEGSLLVNVAVGTGLSLIVISGMTQYMMTNSRSIRTIESRIQAMQLKGELNLVIKNPTKCDDSFKDITSLNLANSMAGDYTDITSIIDSSVDSPIKLVKNNYSSGKNRHINLKSLKLFKPFKTLGGKPNDTSPIEFKLQMTYEEVSLPGVDKVAMGPTIALRVTGTATEANACAPIHIPARTQYQPLGSYSFSYNDNGTVTEVHTLNPSADLLNIYTQCYTLGRNGHIGLTLIFNGSNMLEEVSVCRNTGVRDDQANGRSRSFLMPIPKDATTVTLKIKNNGLVLPGSSHNIATMEVQEVDVAP